MKIPLVERKLDQLFAPPQKAGVAPAGRVIELTARDALRWIAYEAKRCRDRDSCESVCLLPPAILRAYGLPPMSETEVAAFKEKFRRLL